MTPQTIDHLINLPQVKEFLLKEFLKKNWSKLGLKVKDKKTGDIWILASYDSCCQLMWINTTNGCTWGGHFPNNEDPFKKLERMEYELLMPESK